MSREISFKVVWNNKVSQNYFSIGQFFDRDVELQFLDGETLPFDDIDWDTDKVKYLQYTGIKDIEGNKIFEGDIVEQNIHEDFAEFAMKGKVTFVDTYFAIIGLGNASQIFYLANGFYKDVKIIGNIHDNPELLKETI